jgi:pyruvate kinase
LINSTKIVATIGPTSEQKDTLQDLISAGVRIMRLNFSHATVEEADLRIENLRAATGENLHCSAVTTSNTVILHCFELTHSSQV